MSTQASGTGWVNDFFGSISSVAGDVAGTVGDTFREVFPVWAKRELNMQGSDNRFRQVLFQPDSAAPRSDSVYTTSGRRTTGIDTTQKAQAMPTLFDLNFGGTRISGMAVALAVIGVVGLALWARS